MNMLKFGKRVVDEQIRFSRKMMKAMDPVMVKIDFVPEPPARKAPTAAKAARASKASKAA